MKKKLSKTMIEQKHILIQDYDYDLPEEKIAFYPLEERNKSKLLVYRNKTITDSSFDKLVDFLDKDHVLFFNDSKVIHARLLVTNENGTPIEIFCLEPLHPTSELSKAFQQTGKVTWKCMVGNAKRWKSPLFIAVSIDGKDVVVKATKGINDEGTFEVTFEWENDNITFAEWIEYYGKIPLPPYIKRAADVEDSNRYQTVYAHCDGSVAAPTAGLHFSLQELELLKEKGIEFEYVTLHVGAGTFKPVSVDLVGDHYMHREQIIIKQGLVERLLKYYDNNKKIIAVGTTVTRTLESLFIMGAKLKLGLPSPFHVNQWEYYEDSAIKSTPLNDALNALLEFFEKEKTDQITASTALMITPGYQHKIVKGLITNFHQPKSTLLLLISSFLGEDWKRIYSHALENQYRFLSYGDSNLYL